MIDERAPKTHAQQISESQIEALKEAGIGTAYAGRSLDDLGEFGSKFKVWIVENRERLLDLGYGFDFRSTGKASTDLVMLTGRALLHLGLTTRIIPLVRLPKMLTSDEGIAELRGLRHLIVRDFETEHECPLRAYEIALVEAMIEERLSDGNAVSVLRRVSASNTTGIAGWWSATTEDLIEQNARVVSL